MQINKIGTSLESTVDMRLKLECNVPRLFWIQWAPIGDGQNIMFGDGSVVGENRVLTFADLSDAYPINVLTGTNGGNIKGEWVFTAHGGMVFIHSRALISFAIASGS